MWIRIRDINGNWVWYNTKTKQTRSTLPGSEEEKQEEQRKHNDAVLKVQSAAQAKFNRELGHRRNHSDERVKKVVTKPVITVDSKGNMNNTTVTELAPSEDSTQTISPEFDLITLAGGIKAVPKVANIISNWRPFVPWNFNRYYRIVGSAGNPIGDAIESGVVRAPGANPKIAVPGEDEIIDLGTSLLKPHDYPMFAKGRPWRGSTARTALDSNSKPIIVRSKADTGSIIWEKSNKDFVHKGHDGIFRPRYNGDLNSAPTKYFEYWEPKRFGYMRRDFPIK